jgi:hypothetical protein
MRLCYKLKNSRNSILLHIYDVLVPRLAFLFYFFPHTSNLITQLWIFPFFYWSPPFASFSQDLPGSSVQNKNFNLRRPPFQLLAFSHVCIFGVAPQGWPPLGYDAQDDNKWEWLEAGMSLTSYWRKSLAKIDGVQVSRTTKLRRYFRNPTKLIQV